MNQEESRLWGAEVCQAEPVFLSTPCQQPNFGAAERYIPRANAYSGRGVWLTSSWNFSE